MVTSKTKETNAMIDNLTDNLSELRPVSLPYKRTILWGMFAFSIALLLAALLNDFRHDLSKQLHNTSFIIENIALLAIGFAALFSAFRLSIPDIKRDSIAFAILIISSIILAGLTVINLMNADYNALVNTISVHKLPDCISSLFILISIPTMSLFILIKNSASVTPIWAGYAVLLAMSSIGALIMRYICPVDEATHLFLTHFSPAVLMSLMGLAIGHLFLRW